MLNPWQNKPIQISDFEGDHTWRSLTTASFFSIKPGGDRINVQSSYILTLRWSLNLSALEEGFYVHSDIGMLIQ